VYTAVACLLWLSLLIAMFVAPGLTATADPGDDLTRNTVRLALLYYAAALTLLLSLTSADWASSSRRVRLARCCWTLAWAAFVLHVGMALHHFDHWSHAATIERTHRRTGFGEGVLIAYLFTLLWTADVAYWWLRPAAYAARRPAFDRALHAFMLFMVFNGTVVFEEGPIRWVGLAFFLGLAAAWLGRRSGRIAFPSVAAAVYDSGTTDRPPEPRQPGSGLRGSRHGPSGSG
jgi:hypothetical protein